ncbi:hypothetical protein NHX12_007666 [Muraenolepis orangiensis]|uniref:Germinal-center associated nuclear protein n=1 Tax=Muraenolepis orangiensis TaxID=630683 RepID=A0A9Q0IBE7_9TELE|nr:hypothetical protein NHX12_007666 [Muraenolepis orangiensis]
MNPNNVFAQGGAFQAPPAISQPAGLFQAFGPQGATRSTASLFQPSTFGQPSHVNQAGPMSSHVNQAGPMSSHVNQAGPMSSHVNQAGPMSSHVNQAGPMSSHVNQAGPMFGQTQAFGQPSLVDQSSGQPAPMSQAPSFGQPAVGQSSSSFSTSSTPAFGQTSGSGQAWFGQSSSFGQSPGFGLTSAPGSANTLVSSAGTTGTSGPVQNVPAKSFGSTDFSFKPSNEALFKPIFSASPEPTNPSAPAGPQTAPSSTAPGFSLLTGAKSVSLGFSFSKPTTAPSVSAHKDPMASDTGGDSSSALKFTFSQPAIPSSPTGATAPSGTPAQPTTPSSFSFSATVLQPQAAPFFGATGFGQTSAFGDPNAKPEAGAKDRGAKQGGALETNVFARLGKGTKRKEEPEAQLGSGSEKLLKEDQTTSPVAGATQRHPSKRALLRPRASAGGLFGRAMSGLMKNPGVGREKSQQQVSDWGGGESGDSPAQTALQAAAPPRSQAPTREVLEKAGDSDSAKTPEPEAVSEQATPPRPTYHSESSESGPPPSPTDCTVLQCRNVPPALNKKEPLEKHFGRFGKVRRVFCRPNKNLAIIHFQDHASAAKAKKKGKMLQRHELLLFWQRKKQSPGEPEREGQAGRRSPAGGQLGPCPQLTLCSSATFSRSSPVKKSSIAKALQFDSEPQHEGSSDSQSYSSEHPVPSSLLHLIGQSAETAEDKYRLLEQRDKIMRQGRPKRTDLVLSEVLVGTCPDMCPEKERFMRDTRNQLSCFELFPGAETVDHRAAIKEYSRSSADQEEPLPHELRPLPVLGMTMDYLVTTVMDQGLHNYRDWYDFVWNRTRGIRKDVIQQHLCCPQTVALIEKCTRFHVHCAHHLCEESLMTFDAKINNENMTKCLQSLKELYQDLAERQLYCPREAEFRLYTVLLNLNDGDILREVQQFRDEVRNSVEVKFAVQAFTALNTNNFVRFFKLVKCASYLASCLLHRYFNQVRAKAVLTLNIAHTVGSQRSTMFPIEDLARMLMFPDAAEASHFIQQYGLLVSDGMVELSRTAFQEPEVSLSLKRSDFILGKRHVLIGEVVNGVLLPSPPTHSPASSFDAHNKYRGEGATPTEPSTGQSRASTTSCITATSVAMAAAPGTSIFSSKFLQDPRALPEVEVQPQVRPTRLFGDQPQPSTPSVVEPAGESGIASLPPSGPAQQLFQPLFPPQPVKAPSPLPPPGQPPPPQPPAYSDLDLVSVMESVLEEEVATAVREVAHKGVTYARLALVESDVQVEVLLGEVIGQVLQEVSSTEIQLEASRITEEKRRIEDARRKREWEAFLVQFSFSLCAEVLRDVLAESIQQTAREQLQEAERDQRELVALCTEQVCTGLVEETLQTEIALLADDMLEAELQHIHKYIKRWREVVAVRRQLKRQMRGFPAAPCGVDPGCKLWALTPSAPQQPSLSDLARGVVNLGSAGDMALSSTRLLRAKRQTLHQMRVHYYYQEAVWAPLDLPALVTDNIPNPPDRIFWKAAMLLPSDHESVASLADRVLSHWLEVKLGGGERAEVKEKQVDGTLQTLCVTNTLQEAGERAHKVHLTIKVSRGPLSDEGFSRMEDGCELQGTGALLLLLPALPSPVAGQEDQDVPLLSALLQLKQLQQASAWHSPLPLVILVPGAQLLSTRDTHRLEEESTSDLQASRQLTGAVRWLLARSPPARPLSCQTLVQFVEAGLSRHFSNRLQARRRERSSAGRPSLGAEPVVCLYNAVLSHLADSVSSPELLGLSWPAVEFSLPEARHLVPHLGWNSAQHLAWLRSAVLGLRLPLWDTPPVTASWSQLCSSVLHYASQIPGSPHGHPLLMSRLENLLERVRQQYRHRGPPHHRRSGPRGSRDQHQGPDYNWVPWDDLLVLCIDYKLKDWPRPEPSLCPGAMTEDGEVLVYFLTESLKRFDPPEEWNRAVRLAHRHKRLQTEGGSGLEEEAPSPPSLRQRLFQSLERLPGWVLRGLEEEKVHSQRSTDQLKHWLTSDPPESLSMPLFIPSSTLLSPPTAGVPSSKAKKALGSPLTKKAKSSDVWIFDDGPESTASPPLSLARRLRDVQRQILASREAELACRLRLDGLLGIVDD